MARAREIGRIVDVIEEQRGTTMRTAAGIGVTTLEVDDPSSDFDEDGGELEIGGDVYTFISVDDDARTIELASGLVAAVDDGDRVRVFPEIPVRYAICTIDDALEESDAVYARLPLFLHDRITTGKQTKRMWAGLEQRQDEWWVTDLLGQTPTFDPELVPGGGDGHSHDGTGTNSTIIGGVAEAGATVPVASGAQGLAAGDNAQSTADNAIAIGPGDTTLTAANATAEGAIAIGSGDAIVTGPVASGVDSIVIGRNAFCNVANGIAIGRDATGGTRGVAIGFGSTGSADNVAIGFNASAGAPRSNAVVVGASASITGNRSVAVGASATAALDGVAVGNTSTAIDRSVAVGKEANSGHDRAVAMGYRSVTTAVDQIAVKDRHFEMDEMSADPAAPAANKGRVYMRDNGSGKTQYVVRFPTGAVQVLATEP